MHDSQKKWTLYVGALPFTALQQDIEAHFAGCEVVSCRLLYDKGAAKNFKGIAFIDIVGSEGLRKALKLDNSNFGGRRLKVFLDKTQKIKGDISLAQRPEEVMRVVSSAGGQLEVNTVVLALLSIGNLTHVSPIEKWGQLPGWKKLLSAAEARMPACLGSQFLKIVWVFAKLPGFQPQGGLLSAIQQHASKYVSELQDFKSIAKLEYSLRSFEGKNEEAMKLLTVQAKEVVETVNNESAVLNNKTSTLATSTLQQCMSKLSVKAAGGSVLVVEDDSRGLCGEVFKEHGMSVTHWRRFSSGSTAGKSWPPAPPSAGCSKPDKRGKKKKGEQKNGSGSNLYDACCMQAPTGADAFRMALHAAATVLKPGATIICWGIRWPYLLKPLSFSPLYRSFKVVAESKDACVVRATCAGDISGALEGEEGGNGDIGRDDGGDIVSGKCSCDKSKHKLSGWRTIVDVELEKHTLTNWRVYPGRK
jgi:hypothetical protein